MVKPIESLVIVPHPIGSELNLNWALPVTLPEQNNLILLKKPSEDLTSEEINSYFALWAEIEELKKSDNPDLETIATKTSILKKGLKDSKIYVARFLVCPVDFVDMLCVNGVQYFYKIFIQDTKTYELSEAVSCNAIPQITAKTTLVDAKSLTRRAVTRILKSLESQNNPEKLNINVQKEFHRLEGINQWVTVNRAAAEIEQRFYGNRLYSWNQYNVQGFIEKEVIQVTWFSRENPDYLDALTKLFRSQISALTRYFYHNNVIEVLINMMPDGVDERDTDSKTLYSGMLIAVLSETRTVVEDFSAPVVFEFENLNVESECENNEILIEYQ